MSHETCVSVRSHYFVSSNTIQYVIGLVVCAFYRAATVLHHAILRARSDLDPKIVWMGSCGLVGVGVAFAAWVIFTLIIASSFLIYGILHYAVVIVGIVGLGLGVAGAMHFSQDVQPAKPAASSVSGAGAAAEYYYRSSTTSASSYRSYDD